MENQVPSSLTGAVIQCDWLMVVDLFSRYTSPLSATIGDNIDAVLASGAGAAGSDLLRNQPSSSGAALGTLQKEYRIYVTNLPVHVLLWGISSYLFCNSRPSGPHRNSHTILTWL
jgi:hypothetical protein